MYDAQRNLKYVVLFHGNDNWHDDNFNRKYEFNGKHLSVCLSNLKFNNKILQLQFYIKYLPTLLTIMPFYNKTEMIDISVIYLVLRINKHFKFIFFW